MPKPLVLELTPGQKGDVEGLLRRRELPRHTRMRAECVRLSRQGRAVSETAAILTLHPVTVRRALHRFTAGWLAGGLAGGACRHAPVAGVRRKSPGRTWTQWRRCSMRPQRMAARPGPCPASPA